MVLAGLGAIAAGVLAACGRGGNRATANAPAHGGTYDNATFGFRGHQYTDAEGRYVLETVVPGLYPGRTRHIHVKVQAPGGPVLTTQLYFPGEARNASDGIYRKECEMAVTNVADGKAGTFTFVVDS